MAYLSWLEKALAAKLGEQPIGTAVALRAYVQLTSDHGQLSSNAAAVIAQAEGWFGSTASSFYAQGGAESGYISALAQFVAGQTALVVSELVRPGDGTPREEPQVKLLVVGNRGTIEFFDTPGSDGLAVDLTPPIDPRAKEILRDVERSVRSGQPASALAG